MSHPILLYDGVCGLCNRMVQFILRRDPHGVFRFASLQSELAAHILARHGADARDLDTVYVVVNAAQADELLLARSDAVVFVLRRLSAGVGRRPTDTPPTPRSFFWRLCGTLMRAIPRAIREWGYRMIARNRYRAFGRYDSCPLPTEETRSRFLA